MLKTRLVGLLIVILCAAMIWYGWYQLQKDGTYYMKMATFAPVGVVGGIFMMLFPSMSGKPNTTKARVIVLVVFVIGLIAGLINWFLMDPGFFGYSQ